MKTEGKNVNKFREFIQSIVNNSFYACIISIAVGLLLLFFPATISNTLVRVVGIGMILGAGSMVYSSYRNNNSIDKLSLVLAVLAALVGLYFIIRPTGVQHLISTLIGLFILVHGLINFFSARAAGADAKGLIPAGISIVLGILLVFNLFGAFTITVRLIGIFIAIDGVSGLLNSKKA